MACTQLKDCHNICWFNLVSSYVPCNHKGTRKLLYYCQPVFPWAYRKSKLHCFLYFIVFKLMLPLSLLFELFCWNNDSANTFQLLSVLQIIQSPCSPTLHFSCTLTSSTVAGISKCKTDFGIWQCQQLRKNWETSLREKSSCTRYREQNYLLALLLTALIHCH